ncbi:hypothetical protein ACA910_011256 [Epithemia clementina (nom. ined.)]
MLYPRRVIRLNNNLSARFRTVSLNNESQRLRQQVLQQCGRFTRFFHHSLAQLADHRYSSTFDLKNVLVRQQQRCFASVASVGSGEGCASTSTKASSPKQLKQTAQSALSSTVKSNSSASTVLAQSKVLQKAAMEADRLSQLARAPPSTLSNENKVATDMNDRATKKATLLADEILTIRIEEAKKAAKALVRISNIKSLADAILQQNDCQSVAKVHRAFISVVTWGLSLITAKPADTPMTSSLRASASSLMEKLVEVVRRAHELELPLHIPLYHRFLEQVAAHSASMKKTDPVDAIVDISIYATASLDLAASPQEASAEWLEPLVEQFLAHPNNKEHPRIDHVDRLLEGMRESLGIKQMSFDATLDMLLRLRAIFRKSLKKPKKLQFAREATSIVQWLEPSLVNMMHELNNGPTFPSPSSANRKENLLHDMLLWDQENPASDDAYALIMSRILRWGPPPRPRGDGSDGSTTSTQRRIHPFDIIADTILTRGLKDYRAKELASDILQFVRLRSGIDEDDVLPDLRNNNTSSSSSHGTIPTSRSDSGGSSRLRNDEEDADLSSNSEPRHYQYDDIVDEDYPDVTSQLVRWNGDGRLLSYTSEYKAIVGIDDDEEESDDSFVRPASISPHIWDDDDFDAEDFFEDFPAVLKDLDDDEDDEDDRKKK